MLRKAIITVAILATLAAIAGAQVIQAPFQTTVGGCVYNTASVSALVQQGVYLQCDSAGLLKTTTTATSPLAPTVTAAISNVSIISSSAKTLWGAYATNTSAVPGYFMIFDSATVPGDGAVTPKECLPLPGGGNASLNFNGGPGSVYASGIAVAMSTTGCFTKTTSLTMSGFFRASVQ